MLTGKEDLLQALIEAYLMEMGTKKFYSYAAEKAMNSEAKKTFRELSEWEGRHMEYIQFLYQSIVEDYDMLGFEEFKNRVESPLTESGIPVKDMEAKVEEYNFMDDRGALTMALEMEGKAYNLYWRFSKGAADTSARVVFKEMMELEAKHIRYLKNLQSKLGIK